LVAHADEYTRRTLENAIDDLGYQHEIVQDGLDFVDRTLDDRPDAVLLGLSIPGVGGLQIARTLRTLHTTKQIPILFITDNTTESTRVLQAALPGVACLQAPFDQGRVREQLMRLVARSETEGIESLQHDSAEALAITDPPTGLFSRTYILHRLAYEGARAVRYQHELAVILLSIRNIDQIVKRHGQRGADAICMDAASLIRRSIRMVDLVGRTETAQFLVILPETGGRGGAAAAQRLCNMLEAALFRVDQTPVQIRVCAGVTHLSQANAGEYLALFAYAENALQRAQGNPNLRIIES
jgi:diguanylate cyclase (GGDEF)-like protein